MSELASPVQGTVVWRAEPGTTVVAGTVVALVESMKMQHEVRADAAAVVLEIAELGATVAAGEAIAVLDPEMTIPTG